MSAGGTGSSGAGGNGAVVVITYFAAPVITSSLAPSYLQNQAISYAIATSNNTMSYAVSGLPAGLTLNAATGIITGAVTVPGTYHSTLTLTNRGGTTTASLDWTVAADITAPTAPAVSTSNIGFNSLTLAWSGSTDNVGVVGYEVFSNGVSLGTASSQSIMIGGLFPGLGYALTVRARDAVGNWSATSTAQAVTMPIPTSAGFIGGSVFNPDGQNTQSYTVPPDAAYVVVHTRGASGGGSFGGPAFRGDFTAATYNVSPGNQFTVTVGTGGLSTGTGGWPSGGTASLGGGGGGGYSSVQTPFGTVSASGGLGGGESRGLGGATALPFASGTAYNVVHEAGVSDLNSAGNGAGGNVVVFAYRNLPGVTPQTFYATGATQTYTVPSNAGVVVVKAWGAAGGSSGGAGAYVTASYAVSPNQTISVYAGQGGLASGTGGEASKVILPGNTVIYAAGGGGGGGSAGGAPNAQSGGGTFGGGGGNTSGTAGTGSSIYGIPGAGGYGDGFEDDPDDENDGILVGLGATGSTNSPASGGGGGLPGNSHSPASGGGGGGGGLGGGGGGGGGSQGGGGGGGSSGIVVVGQSLLSSSMLASSGGGVAPNASDPYYPGGFIGAGGGVGGVAGRNGAVVIIAYAPAPVVTSSSTQSRLQNQSASYTITATNSPTAYAAVNLPSGLTLNPATGAITGSIAATGTYTSTISATNFIGTGTATLTWTITADTVGPNAPVVSAANLTTTSFLLSWTVPSDNVGVTGYEVKRGGVSLGATTATSMNITGLTLGTTYGMTVGARDAAANWTWTSALSVTLSLDTVGPATVGGIAAPTGSVLAKAVMLTWSAATDNLGVVAYNIYRGDTLIATTAELAYVDTGLSVGTIYAYTVKAVDAAGNLSVVSVSSPFSVTTASATASGIDSDDDGVPNALETAARLGTNPNAAATIDTTNELQLNLHRPNP